MAHTPDTTGYSSPTNLSLGQVPQVEDPELYRALLDIHNAIDTLLITLSSSYDYSLKHTTVVEVSSDATFAATTGIMLIDAAASGPLITMHSGAANLGGTNILKRVDSSANTVTVQAAGGETIDGGASLTLAVGAKLTLLATAVGFVTL